VSAVTPGQAAYADDLETARAALAEIATTLLEGPEDERYAIVATARGALLAMKGTRAAQEPEPAPDTPGSVGHPDDSDAGQGDTRNRQNGQPAPGPQAGEVVYLYHWRFDRGEEFGLYRHAADADARAAEHAGDGLSEVLSMAVLGRPEQPAPGLRTAWRLADERRELLDEIGTLAANAPEDGDSFAVLEDIAMRIAAHGVPEEGK